MAKQEEVRLIELIPRLSRIVPARRRMRSFSRESNAARESDHPTFRNHRKEAIAQDHAPRWESRFYLIVRYSSRLTRDLRYVCRFYREPTGITALMHEKCGPIAFVKPGPDARREKIFRRRR